jgi:hypothetical protein
MSPPVEDGVASSVFVRFRFGRCREPAPWVPVAAMRSRPGSSRVSHGNADPLIRIGGRLVDGSRLGSFHCGLSATKGSRAPAPRPGLPALARWECAAREARQGRPRFFQLWCQGSDTIDVITWRHEGPIVRFIGEWAACASLEALCGMPPSPPTPFCVGAQSIRHSRSQFLDNASFLSRSRVCTMERGKPERQKGGPS